MRYVEACGLRVSVIGLGTWQFGSPEWGWGTQFGPAEALAVVDRARALGVTLIDTAELYGRGGSERLLGRALADPAARDPVVLASKVTPTWPTRTAAAAARGSLARLGTDHLDLYQVHWPNPLVPQRSTMAGMRTLRPGAHPPRRGEQLQPRPLAGRRGRPGGPVVSTRSATACSPASPSGSCCRTRPPPAAWSSPTAPRPGGADRQVHGRHRPRRGPGREPAVLAREPAPGRAGAVGPARAGRRPPGHPGPGRPGLGGPPPGRGRHPRAKSVAQVEANAAAADLRLAPTSWPT